VKRRSVYARFALRHDGWQIRVVLLAGLCWAGFAQAGALPDFATVKSHHVSSEARLLDLNGELLTELRVDPKIRRLDWIPVERFSPALKSALIASEDKRFYEHAGVDWQAFAGAMWDNLRRSLEGKRPRGASTISMQLVGILDESLRLRGPARTLGQKWDQALEARELEKHWTKAQILEAYLNVVSFRGELAGIGAAARGLFGKDPDGLDIGESAILVALLRGPHAAPTIVGQRACAVAVQLRERTDCHALTDLAVATLSGRYRIDAINLAPQVARKLLRQTGTAVESTLDAPLQRFATESLRRQLDALSGREVRDGAVLVLDNASGDVLAYVGSSGDRSGAPEVDGVTALRQPGSTLKPLLYELAIEKRWLTAASIVDDSPLNLATPVGLYVPQDYDRDFKGPVSVRSALASSLNVPAVRTLTLVGVEAFHDRLRALGFDSLTEAGDFYGYALALGSGDVSLLALTNAFRALANGGEWSGTRMRADDPPGPRKRVMGREASFIVADILSDPAARALTFGLDNPLATRVWSAVKTGTSKDMRDNWCVGFSNRYTVGVWVGNFAGTPMRDVSGISGAAPVWRDIVDFLHTDVPSDPPRPPRNVTARLVRFEPPLEPPRREWFVTGTEIELVEAKPTGSAAMPRIAYPAPGTVIAIDPDIPPARQRVIFVARDGAAAALWALDGTRLPAEGGSAQWPPTPGHHRLVLTDRMGKELDSVEFEVRGAAMSNETEQQRGEQ
jgi:penicillin-binding protein 1C